MPSTHLVEERGKHAAHSVAQPGVKVVQHQLGAVAGGARVVLARGSDAEGGQPAVSAERRGRVRHIAHKARRRIRAPAATTSAPQEPVTLCTAPCCSCCAALRCAVPCCAVLCHAVPCCAALLCAALCSP